MNTAKMCLENIQGKLSRKQMSKIMAGSDENSNLCSASCASDTNDCNGGCKCVGEKPWRVCVKQ
jgi:hypothetical protein